MDEIKFTVNCKGFNNSLSKSETTFSGENEVEFENSYIPSEIEVTVSDIDSGTAVSGLVITSDGLGGATWEEAASGGTEDYASVSSFPATGEEGVIYLALDTNRLYRWDATNGYVELGSEDESMATNSDIDFLFMNLDPVMANNSWAMLQAASKAGYIPSTWRVGNTKNLTYDSQTYAARLVDKTGKFKRTVDGSTAYLSFELVNVLETDEKYNSNMNGRPAASELLAKMNSGTIWANFDSELKACLEEVNVKAANSANGLVEDFPLKLFLPRVGDFNSRQEHSVYSEFIAISEDTYYQTHSNYSYKIKTKLSDPLTACMYWTMSVDKDSNLDVCIYQDGNGIAVANIARSVAIRFAL